MILEISWFEPSSNIKIVLFRGFKIKTPGKLTDDVVGQYEGKIVDLFTSGKSRLTSRNIYFELNKYF